MSAGHTVVTTGPAPESEPGPGPGPASQPAAGADPVVKEMQRAVDGISQRMLALTVRRLERDVLVSRTVCPTVPARVEYELTEVGPSLTRLIKPLTDRSLCHRSAVAGARRAWDGDTG
ncbi:helix-turn-helix domain-containing protein [Streptomyces sp. NPDC051219]|uniref:winged helix-turn-helix transcriptional regulator n=1 Tax=Streptomyces sp. NPDC051219 TaxID=3155283 RepID=UPI003430C25C